jgi:hypothetical protein
VSSSHRFLVMGGLGQLLKFLDPIWIFLIWLSLAAVAVAESRVATINQEVVVLEVTGHP